MGTSKILTEVDWANVQTEELAFTNGCFEILHPGHARFLSEAKKLGKRLLVALNSDQSILRLKGHESFYPEAVRAEMLSYHEAVDYVCVFDESTCLGLLSAFKPCVWVKGGDYKLETLNKYERRAVESWGGRIVIIPFMDGYSTGRLIERAKKITLK